jgi:hypothetical protein
MNLLCTDNHSHILTKNLKAETCTKVNFDLNCSQFFDYIVKNERVLRAAKSSAKYSFLNKN